MTWHARRRYLVQKLQYSLSSKYNASASGETSPCNWNSRDRSVLLPVISRSRTAARADSMEFGSFRSGVDQSTTRTNGAGINRGWWWDWVNKQRRNAAADCVRRWKGRSSLSSILISLRASLNARKAIGNICTAKSMNVDIDRIRHAHKHTSGTGRHRNAAALFLVLHVLVPHRDRSAERTRSDAFIAPVRRARDRKTHTHTHTVA